jgi:hypothetical protein
MIPKFCKDCGAKLVWGKKRLCGYDAKDGKREFIQVLQCPLNRWYQIWHFQPSEHGIRRSRPYYKTTKEII